MGKCTEEWIMSILYIYIITYNHICMKVINIERIFLNTSNVEF